MSTMQHDYRLTFGTNRPIDPETRRRLKSALGDLIRQITEQWTDVAIDQVERKKG